MIDSVHRLQGRLGIFSVVRDCARTCGFSSVKNSERLLARVSSRKPHKEWRPSATPSKKGSPSTHDVLALWLIRLQPPLKSEQQQLQDYQNDRDGWHERHGRHLRRWLKWGICKSSREFNRISHTKHGSPHIDNGLIFEVEKFMCGNQIGDEKWSNRASFWSILVLRSPIQDGSTCGLGFSEDFMMTGLNYL